MAEIAPLRALRFRDDELPKVVAPPYDVIGPEDRRELGARSPHNIVHLDLPEGEGDEKYANAARKLRAWVEAGVLRRDDKPILVRYDQSFDPPGGGPRVTRRGFLCLVRAQPYDAKVVLPHERTLSGPKEDRYRLFVATRAALSPVFLLYSDPSHATRRALEHAKETARFTTPDGTEHALATIDDPKAIDAVRKALLDQQLLIADGHHRYETTLRYGATVNEERRARGAPPSPNGAHEYVLSFLADADDPGLVVFPTHRLVHGVRGFDADAMLRAAGITFDVKPVTGDDAAIVRALEEAGKRAPTVAAVFRDGRAMLLSLRDEVDLESHPALRTYDPVLRRMDVAVLHGGILESVLGITKEKQASQEHLAYFKLAAPGLAALRKGEGDVLFLMNATPVADVRRACTAGAFMPQKSTFFYPKVLTGLAVHVLDPEEIID